MKQVALHIYRECYADSALKDIWDKITNALNDAGVANAEQIGLQLTEWIRATWGGQLLVDRHREQPRGYSRFDLLRDHALVVLGNPALAAEISRVVRVNYHKEYLPRVKRLDQLQRDIEIFNRGNSHSQMERLGQTHSISTVRVYQINKRMAASKKAWEEPTLPGVA